MIVTDNVEGLQSTHCQLETSFRDIDLKEILQSLINGFQRSLEGITKHKKLM